MKKISYLLSLGVLVAILAVMGCSSGGGDDAPIEDQAGANFSGTWIVGTGGSVTFDTQDRTTDYSDFVLNVNFNNGQGSGTFTTSGGQIGASPWPVSGIWSFNGAVTNANTFSIIRQQDGLIITVVLTATNMTLTFTFDSAIHQGNRTEAVNGQWAFNLEKQQ